MSIEKQHMDNLFKDKLQNYEVVPSDKLWNTINDGIKKEKRKKRLLAFWFSGAGIAASLVVVFFINQLIQFNTNSPITTTQNTIVEYCIEKEDNVKQDTINKLLKEIPSEEVSIVEHSDSKLKEKTTSLNIKAHQKEKALAAIEINTNNKEKLKPLKISNPPEKRKEERFTRIKPIKKKNPETDLENNAIANELNELAEITKNKLIEKNNSVVNISKWSIKPQVAPLVYKSSSGNSSIGSDFDNNPQNTSSKLSYGVKIAYAINTKWSIRTGLSTASVQINTNNIGVVNTQTNTGSIIFNDSNGVSGLVSNIKSEDLQPEDIQSSPPINFSPITNDSELENDVKSKENGRLQQTINYIEIPFELSYKIIDRKIGLNLISGFSTFILNEKENSIVFISENNAQRIGSANNLNNTVFSGNIGIGIDYHLAKNIQLSLEPTVKVQFNAFNSVSNVNPYLFGVYSGIQFSF